jgi:hypothetical protein
MSGREIKMNNQLWELNVDQAQEVLDAFLSTERAAFSSVEIDSIELDYSPESVMQAAHHVATVIETGRLNGEQQNLWFMRLGYYLGESLRRAKPGLSWGLGNPQYAFANHPVIMGFADDEEAPVITICKNMIRSVAEGRSPPERIDDCIRYWFGTGLSSKR